MSSWGYRIYITLTAEWRKQFVEYRFSPANIFVHMLTVAFKTSILYLACFYN